MKKDPALSIICTIIFFIGIVAAFLGYLIPEAKTLKYTLLAVSFIYLFSGWYIFKGYHPDGHPLLLFLMGYLYSSVFLAFAFVTFSLPGAKTFIFIAPFWAATQLIMVAAIRKKLSKEGFIQFLTEGGLMIILSIILLIKY